MRIQKITVCDFRAFPGSPQTSYELELPEGRNLLLHGENGSGKSSLFQALRGLFALAGPAPAPGQQPEPGVAEQFGLRHKHVFSDPNFTAGVVNVELTNGMPNTYSWTYGQPHEAEGGNPQFQELARRATFLDYKALLRTNFLHEQRTDVELFPLLMSVVFRHAENPVMPAHKLREQWEELTTRDLTPPPPEPPAEDDEPEELETPEQRVRNDARTWWGQFRAVLQRVARRANRYVRVLAPGIRLHLGARGRLRLRSGPPHDFGFSVRLSATYYGQPVAHPALFLNEARLSAIAISLYLAAAQETVPPPTAADYPRLLVFDDVLMGLDLSNRLPVLDLLEKEFADWQIFLFTHDWVWFEMAQKRLGDKRWEHHRLFVRPDHDREVPMLVKEYPYLEKARQWMDDGELKSAGVYLRAGFEEILRKFCAERSLSLAYKLEAKKYKSEDFWAAVKIVKFNGQRKLLDDGFINEVELCRGHVLNPLCHDDPGHPFLGEVRTTHGVLLRLECLLAAWPKKGPSQPKAHYHLEQAIAAIDAQALEPIKCVTFLRSAFDYGLRQYWLNHPLNNLTGNPRTLDLWQEVATSLGNLAAPQPAFVQAVTTNADILLNEPLDFAAINLKTKADFEAALNLLIGAHPKNDPKCVLDFF
jgi:energy-coupling factor transporter ATP-binding protein EcfA2